MDNSKAVQDSLARIESKLTAVESRLNSDRRETESRLDVLERSGLSEGAVTPSPGLNLRRINQATERMARAQGQSQILAEYLEEAQSMVSRVMLFRKEHEGYSKWQSIGFDSESVDPIDTRNQSSPIIRAAANKQVVACGDGLGETFPWLRESKPPPLMTLCIPLVFGDCVPMVLYLESAHEMPIDSLELLTHQVVLILKNQYLQQLTALDSGQAEGAVADKLASPEPLQSTEQEQSPADAMIERSASKISEDPAAVIIEETMQRPAETSEKEVAESLEAPQKQGPLEPADLIRSAVPADQEPILKFSKDPEPEVEEPDPSPVLTLPKDPEPEGQAPESDLVEPRPNNPEIPVEVASQEEASGTIPLSSPPEFSYKKVPSKDGDSSKDDL
ncbi:MAG: hypothetical protein V3R94_11255, partial [Acidobacteriota bacterium]